MCANPKQCAKGSDYCCSSVDLCRANHGGLRQCGGYDYSVIIVEQSVSKIDRCGFKFVESPQQPSILEPQQVLAKWNCDGDRTKLYLDGNKVYAKINGTKCGLRIGLGEEASTYLGSADSRNAIFDCNGVADAVQYEDGHVFAKSSARTSCALDFHRSKGSLAELGPNDRLALWRCNAALEDASSEVTIDAPSRNRWSQWGINGYRYRSWGGRMEGDWGFWMSSYNSRLSHLRRQIYYIDLQKVEQVIGVAILPHRRRRNYFVKTVKILTKRKFK